MTLLRNMSFEELCAISDFCSFVVTDLIIGRKTYKTGRSFLPVMSRSQRNKIKVLLHRAISGVQHIDNVLNEMKIVFVIQSYLNDKSPEEILKIDRHLVRYFKVVRPQSKFTVVKCDRYKEDVNEGVKIIAKADICRGNIIRGLELCVSKYTNREYATLTERDKNYLFDGKRMGLGPAAWINHSCEPNTKFVWLVENSVITVEALRNIKAGKEILVKYRENYFGDECLCDVCV